MYCMLLLKLGEAPSYIQRFLCFYHPMPTIATKELNHDLLTCFSAYMWHFDTFAFWWNQTCLKYLSCCCCTLVFSDVSCTVVLNLVVHVSLWFAVSYDYCTFLWWPTFLGRPGACKRARASAYSSWPVWFAEVGRCYKVHDETRGKLSNLWPESINYFLDVTVFSLPYWGYI